MLAFVGASLGAYVLALIAVGVYVAIRVKRGADYFGSAGTKLAMVIVFALLGTIPTEILTVIWLGVVRDYIDITANLNLFVVAVAPVVAAIVTIQALLLSPAYRSRPLLHGAMYLGVYAAAYAVWMNALFNPVQDIFRAVATVVIVGSLVLLLIAKFLRRGSA